MVVVDTSYKKPSSVTYMQSSLLSWYVFNTLQSLLENDIDNYNNSFCNYIIFCAFAAPVNPQNIITNANVLFDPCVPFSIYISQAPFCNTLPSALSYHINLIPSATVNFHEILQCIFFSWQTFPQ